MYIALNHQPLSVEDNIGSCPLRSVQRLLTKDTDKDHCIKMIKGTLAAVVRRCFTDTKIPLYSMQKCVCVEHVRKAMVLLSIGTIFG